MKKFFVFVIFVTISIHMFVFEQGMGGDGWGYYAILESVVVDRDLNLDNNIYGIYNGFTQDPETGRFITQYPPGLALMDFPFFLIADSVAQIFRSKIPDNSISHTQNADNITPLTLIRIFSVILAHNFYALLGLFLLYLTLVRNNISSVTAGFLIFFSYFASPLHYYAQSGMSHSNSFFVISAILYLFSKYVHTKKHNLWFFIGLFCGLGMAVRYVNALMFPVCCFFLLLNCKDRKLGTLFKLFAGFAVVACILPCFWWLHAGQLRPGYTGNFSFDRLPLINILFSLKRGFLVFHPLFILFIPGFFAFFIKYKEKSSEKVVAWFAFISLITLCTVYGYWGEWWGADAYSQRFVLDCLACFVFCMAPFFSYLFSKLPGRIFCFLALLYSYTIFIISISHVITFPNETFWAESILDFKCLIPQYILLEDVLKGVYNHSVTMKAISSVFR